MAHPSLVPSLNEDVHFVLCEFGLAGVAYVETPRRGGRHHCRPESTACQYERPLQVLALNAREGWSRDVSEAIAAKVRDVAEHEGRELTSGTLAFIGDHIGRALQPTLPLW
jgi:hypothetical protein